MISIDFSHEKPQSTKEQLVQEIQRRVITEVDKVEKDIDALLFHLEHNDHLQFSNLDLNEDNPFFVFENDELIYWSDYKTPIEKKMVKVPFHWKTIKTKSGVYLIDRKSVVHGFKKFDVLYFLPLYYDYQIESTYLKPGLNKEIFGDLNVDVFTTQIDGGLDINSGSNEYLFSVNIYLNHYRSGWVIVAWLGLLIMGYLAVSKYVFNIIRFYHGQNKFYVSLIVLFVFLLLSRLCMLWTEFPFKYLDVSLFNPKYFAASDFLPSIGDLLLNVVFICIFALYVYIVSMKSIVYLRLIKLNKAKGLATAVLFILLSYVTYYLLYETLKTVYFHSQLNFDITENIDFSQYKLVYLSAFLFVAGIYFVLNHILFRFLFILKGIVDRLTIFTFAISTAIFFIINWYWLQAHWSIVLAHLLYLLVVYYFQLYKNLSRFKYLSYLYLVGTSMVCAFGGAIGLYEYDDSKEFINKNKFAEQLIIHNDPQGEYLMGEIVKQIKKDRLIKEYFKNPTYNPLLGDHGLARVEEKIQRIYIGNYFDKYKTNVYLYSFEGEPYKEYEMDGTYYDVKNSFNQNQNRTENESLFFINYFEQDILSRYLDFIEIKDRNVTVGYVILDFTLKKKIGRSILPRLLQGQQLSADADNNKYDYAVYSGQDLTYSIGEFNYEKDVFKDLIADTVVFNKDLVINGYHHLVARGFDDKTVIVSSVDDKWDLIITNWSFLFLLTIIFSFLIGVVILTYVQYKDSNLGFSTKIQTYLNIAYFLPLSIVSISLVSITNSNFEEEMQESFKNKAEVMSGNITNYIQTHRDSDLAEDEEFIASIYRLAKYSECEVNLFDTKGKLILSTQPLIYEASLLSELMNPQAQIGIFEQKHKMVMFDEHIGDFNYKSVYVGLTSQDEGSFLGVLSIPFFNSKYEVEHNKITVLSTIMNTFTSIFLVILLLSYFAFKTLTDPLKLVAQRIKRTTFGGDNEKLVWKSDDEIGALVNEYNEMLEKLEESKTALARSEKETAWREMAQQVAHEIKNPLTPMKLKLQHLLRTMTGEDQEQVDRTKKSVSALINQVDILSDIATSFSSFAKMPTPLNHPFNLTQELNNILRLYRGTENLKLNVDIDPEDRFVNGDEKLMGRIFTNLILNGKQAVPEGKVPEISIKSYMNPSKNKMVMEFSDNGEGIPEDIQKKVFIPNFTTKETGSGIGLAVAKRGVEHAGGSIWFETVVGKGTTFFIELPMKK